MAIILGIDPGSRKTGFGLINQVGNRLHHVACGTLNVIAEGSLPERLGAIFCGIDGVCLDHQPVEVSIEKVFMAHNADSALKLGQARGAAIAAVVQHQMPVFEYSARQVKQAVTGQGSAAKNQVAQMVCRLLSLQKTPEADAADALAIAICHAHLRTSLLRFAGASGMRGGRLNSAAKATQSTIGYPR